MKANWARLFGVRGTVIAVLSAAAFTFYCRWLDWPLVLPFFWLVMGLTLKWFGKGDGRRLLQLTFLLVLYVFSVEQMRRGTGIPFLYLPAAAWPMLVTLLYKDKYIGLLTALTAAVTGAFILFKPFHATPPLQTVDGLGWMVVVLLGGWAGIASIDGARTRGVLITAGFWVGFVQAAVALLLHLSWDGLPTRPVVLHGLRPLILNGVLAAFLVMAVLRVFETMFGVITNFTLLELSDFNNPLLKRMVLEAPGTYHHSLVVSHLSEAAADAIGADAPLARVGAYYHDIGKIEKSEYFVENQIAAPNKHETMEPSMSRLVILNHVKEGMELARRHKLHPEVAKFIQEHHGTSLMHYFYQRALEEAKDGEDVDESLYRYPGPKPQSKETAIVMLADSVEGAVRAMDDPTPAKIEAVVRRIINNKFIDGQLDECNITLKEIEMIAAVFTRVLSAMYHGRIKYPEKIKKTADQKQAGQQQKAPPAVGASDSRQAKGMADTG